MSEEFIPTPDITDDDKLWGLLAYIVSIIVPILLLLMEDKKDRPFLKYHAVQSLALGIAETILGTLLSIITLGLGAILIGPAILVINIIYAMKAYKGEYFEIPFITNFIKNQGWV